MQIEINYINLFRAYQTDSVKEMQEAYIATGYTNIQFLEEKILAETKRICITRNILYNTQPYSIKQINDQSWLRLNIEGCLNVLRNEYNQYKDFYQAHYGYAQQTLGQKGHIFQKDEVLYKNQNKEFTVADMLAVAKYAIGIAEAIEPSNEKYAQARASITALQSIETALNNKPEDKPVNKMLHLATSFISSAVKSAVKNDEAKRGITITALLVDLAIDFLCKK